MLHMWWWWHARYFECVLMVMEVPCRGVQLLSVLGQIDFYFRHTHTVPNKTNVPVTSRPNTDTLFFLDLFSCNPKRHSLLSIIILPTRFNTRRQQTMKKNLYTHVFSPIWKSDFSSLAFLSHSLGSIFSPSLSSFSSGFPFPTFYQLFLSIFPPSIFPLFLFWPSFPYALSPISIYIPPPLLCSISFIPPSFSLRFITNLSFPPSIFRHLFPPLSPTFHHPTYLSPLPHSLSFIPRFPLSPPRTRRELQTRVAAVCLHAVVARWEKITRRVLSLHSPY